MALPVSPHFFQLFLEVGDTPSDHSPIGLQLRLARTAHSNAAPSAASAPAGLTGQVRPGSREARQTILVLSQLDL
jgi:hypothetical protein